MRFIIDTFIGIVIIALAIFLYHAYWGSFMNMLFPNSATYTIYVSNVAVEVTVADTDAERIQGLSGVPNLAPQAGKLFIFDNDAKPGIWMKDMKFPLDILWINKDLQVVHIEQNVSPDTFPQVFYPSVDARFVLEVNSYFVSHYRLKEGDTVVLPTSLLPADLRKTLQ